MAGKKCSRLGYIKLLVLEEVSELEVITGVFEATRTDETTIICDGYHSLRKLK